MSLLNQVLTSKTRSEIFRLLFDGRNQEFYLRDIERKTGLAVRSLQQELPKLLELDLIHSRKDGNRVYFKANREHPVYTEIKNLVIKTSDWINRLREDLSREDVEFAFVFGSFAVNKEKATSDVDLCIIGNISLRTLAGLVKPIGRNIQREINPHLYTANQFAKRVESKNHFILSLLETKKIFIIGTEDDLKAMGRQRLAKTAQD